MSPRFAKNTRRRIGLLYHRFYRYSSPDTLKQLPVYTSYIRPHMEYAVPAWDSHLRSHVHGLESLQKFALKVCCKNWNANYEDLLHLSNLPTLPACRRNLKLCFLHRVLCNSTFYTSAPLQPRNVPVNILNTDHQSFVRPFARTNSYFFLSFLTLSSFGIISLPLLVQFLVPFLLNGILDKSCESIIIIIIYIFSFFFCVVTYLISAVLIATYV